MKNIYQIGHLLIDLNKLVAIGELNRNKIIPIKLPLYFDSRDGKNSNLVEAEFYLNDLEIETGIEESKLAEGYKVLDDEIDFSGTLAFKTVLPKVEALKHAWVNLS